MPSSYPVSQDAYTRPGTAEVLGVSTPAHSVHHDNAYDAIEALEAKLGIGASAAAANTVLRGTAAGVTSFGQIVSGDITDGTIATADLAANAVTLLMQASGVATESAKSDSTPGDIPDMSISFPFTGGPCLIGFSATLYGAAIGQAITLDILIDGGLAFRRQYHTKIAASRDIVTMFYVTTVAAGTKIVKMQWATSTVAGAITNTSNQRQLFVAELKR